MKNSKIGYFIISGAIIGGGTPYFIANSSFFYINTIFTAIVALLPIWLYIISRIRYEHLDYVPAEF